MMKTTFLASTLILAGLAVPALADNERGDGPHHWRDGSRHEMGHGMHGEGGSGSFMMGRMFERFDANDDDALSQEEFAAAHAARFEEADANSDGVVTREEAEAMVRARMEERVSRMADRFLSRLDANDDGSISREEFDAHTSERFARLDRNEDGSLSPREGMEAAGHMRDDHRMHGEQRGQGDGPRRMQRQ